ncbi:hypothetical protein INT44_008889 [Umbelopsis vinacea]|uniref:Uncharacterized protein n=1 Tax=Umbelopsis vinacea TaxID=44442 RepID=A0A8H7UL80_9FUNG|nr:hypothetical protein INT44_008889 [Umbelopsis vinacea]
MLVVVHGRYFDSYNVFSPRGQPNSNYEEVFKVEKNSKGDLLKHITRAGKSGIAAKFPNGALDVVKSSSLLWVDVVNADINGTCH